MLKIQFQKRNLLQKEIDAENDESSKFKKRILKKNVSRNPISSDEEIDEPVREEKSKQIDEPIKEEKAETNGENENTVHTTLSIPQIIVSDVSVKEEVQDIERERQNEQLKKAYLC